jgi:DDE superfamily endonuclease
LSGARRRQRSAGGRCSERESCCTRPTGCRTSISPRGWIARWIVWRSGGDDLAITGLTVSRIGRGRVARAVFPPEQVAEVKAVACELPATRGLPLSRFSRAELHRLVIEGGITDASASTIWRWLAEDAIKPWQVRSWIFRRDPDFREKAGWALDLYERRFEGKLLHPGEFVISADEKSQLQALGRRHETEPAGPGRPVRYEFEYSRGGTLAYLAAWDVHHARLFDRVEPTTGIEPFGRLVEQVMSTEPYASARRVFWIADNGSSHAGKASIRRLEGQWRNLRLIHLPVHASWLNQIEIYFSILQRKALTPNDLGSLEELAERLLAFGRHYRQIARPLQWTFTRADLERVLERVDAHQRNRDRAHLRVAA